MRIAASFLALAILLGGCASRKPFEAHIGLELPLAGDAGADGLLVRNAIETDLRASNKHNQGTLQVVTVARDSAHGGSANAHIDEGTDASGLPPQAAAAIRDLARDPTVLLAIGGLQPDIAAADAAAAASTKLPLISIAALPDGCRAAGVPISTPVSQHAVSVRGGASLESLAVARLVLARGYSRVAIRSDGTASRVDPAICLLRLLHGRGGSASASVPSTSDVGSGALVYFAPRGLGALVCDPTGAATLSPSAFTEMGHRGYDSSRVPASCGWLRLRMRDRMATFARFHGRAIFGPNDDVLAGKAADSIALRAIDKTGRQSRFNYSKIRRDDIWDALTDPDVKLRLEANGFPDADSQPTLKCSRGSAYGAWFELQPHQRDWPAPVFIRDQRCFKKWASSAPTIPVPTASQTAADPKRLRF